MIMNVSNPKCFIFWLFFLFSFFLFFEKNPTPTTRTKTLSVAFECGLQNMGKERIVVVLFLPSFLPSSPGTVVTPPTPRSRTRPSSFLSFFFFFLSLRVFPTFLTISFRHETPVLSKPIEVVHLSEDLVVLDKPCSLPVSWRGTTCMWTCTMRL